MSIRRAAVVCILLLSSVACTGPTDGAGSTSSTGAGSTGAGSTGAGSTTSGPVSPPASSGPSGVSVPVPTLAPPKSAQPGLADREQQLDAQSSGAPHVIVRLPGGYEAATYDQQGTILFWSNHGDTAAWDPAGKSAYPASPQVQPTDATVSGALLTDMTHATFIVRGNFTGDASGNAVAFTTGPKGWGAIIAEKNGNIGPSGHPVGPDLIGLAYDFGFVNGHLQTKDCPQNRPIAQCGSHPVVKRWDWTGSDFRVA